MSALPSSPAQKGDLGIVVMVNVEGASYDQADDLHCSDLLKDLGVIGGGYSIADSLKRISQAVSLFLLIGKKNLERTRINCQRQCLSPCSTVSCSPQLC